MKLTAGLEIHQQLDTNKLFCNCPSVLRSDTPEYIIERKLNPVIGETGKIDAAAKYEKSKNQKYLYQVYDTNCLVELDEEPPHEINKEALIIAIQISLLLNCKIFSTTQIMRKTVIDGSNTSGFQRTMLIAHDGYIETSQGKVGIDSVMLEEDAARIISKDKDSKTFRLDRLGIPLVEVTTNPDLHSPEQIKEAALKIGETLRACKVKRGIGTIRQDVNISTENHSRVEIKGFQNTKVMIKTIELEIERQKKTSEEKVSHVRKANDDGTTSFLRPMSSMARMYPETDHPLVKISRELINNTKKNLPKLKSENKKYLQEFGLNDELIALILKQGKIEQFKSLQPIIENPKLIAKSLTLFQPTPGLDIDQIESILQLVKENKISENDVKTVIQKISTGQPFEKAIEKSDVNLKEEVENLIKEKPDLSQGAYMGLIMAKHKGQVNGKDVAEELGKILR